MKVGAFALVTSAGLAVLLQVTNIPTSNSIAATLDSRQPQHASAYESIPREFDQHVPPLADGLSLQMVHDGGLVAVRSETHDLGAGAVERQHRADGLVDFSAVHDAAAGEENADLLGHGSHYRA